MKKITTTTTFAAALLCGLPEKVEAGNRGDYIAGMAVAYCMEKKGGWTRSQGFNYFTSHMREQGISNELLRYYQDDKDGAKDIVATIDEAGGCAAIVRSVRSGSSSSTSPGSVLSDTPFYF